MKIKFIHVRIQFYVLDEFSNFLRLWHVRCENMKKALRTQIPHFLDTLDPAVHKKRSFEQIFVHREKQTKADGALISH